MLASAFLLCVGSISVRTGAAAELAAAVTGNLLGLVVDDVGVPQVGATIQLVNKYNRVVGKTLSGPDGKFAFTSIPGDVYSLRASVPSFFPAIKNRILVEAGLNSVLQIHMATLFSSIELNYAIPTSAMTDEWKWVLRSSPATRPINRYTNVSLTGAEEPVPLFSQTHAALFLSGGEGGLADSDSSFTDMGTGFALSTNIYGNNQVRVSGTFGQSTMTGTPQMALLATYSRKDEGALVRAPEVTFTMAQVGGVGGPLSAANGMGGLMPLRAMSMSTYGRMDMLDGVHLEYGATAESVDYLQHASRVSPFGRLTVDAGKAGEVVAAYSDGGRPSILTRHDIHVEDNKQEDDETQGNTALANTMNGVGRMPEVSVRDGRLRLQRTQSGEVGIRRRLATVDFAASAFYESTVDGRINVAGDFGGLTPGSLLSDSLSTTSFLNVGNYRRSGYLISSTRSFGSNFDLSLAYGRMGGFSADGLNSSVGGQSLMLDQGTKNVAEANVRAAVPVIGTKINAGYGWVESGSVIPRHIFTTQNARIAPGLNIWFRQPLPSMGLPGRLELTANLQNMLAQGYLPFDAGDGRRLLVVQSPRAIRGGLNFIF